MIDGPDSKFSSSPVQAAQQGLEARWRQWQQEEKAAEQEEQEGP